MCGNCLERTVGIVSEGLGMSVEADCKKKKKEAMVAGSFFFFFFFCCRQHASTEINHPLSQRLMIKQFEPRTESGPAASVRFNFGCGPPGF